MDRGSIATRSDGSGKSSGGSFRPASRDVSVSPVSVTASLATAPISPALSSPIGSCSLPWRQQQLADPLVLALGGVPDVRLALERAGQDAQVGQPPDERVGGGLEHADEERAARRPRPRRPCRPCPARRTAPPRRGRGGSGRSRRAARRRPMPLVALPTSTGARIDSWTPLRRHASSSASEISSPSRYFSRTSSSASAAASSSWSRRAATSSASSSGIGISTSLPPSNRYALRWTRST